MTQLEPELEEMLVEEFGFSNHLIKNIKKKNYTAEQIEHLVNKKFLEKTVRNMSHPKAREKARAYLRVLLYGNTGKHTINNCEA